MLSPLLRFVALAALAAPLLAAAASPAQPDSRELAQLAARAAVGAAPAYHLPARRSYDSHHYYAVEIRASHSAWTDPRDVAEALGTEFVERVGELRDHWLVRSPKPLVRATDDEAALQARQPERFADVPLHQDAVMKRWHSLSHAHFAPAGTAAFSPRTLSAAEAIRSVERQELRRRHKRDIIYDPPTMRHLYPEMRAPVPGPAPHPYPDPLPRPPPIPSAKAAQMMGTHDIRDPIFAEQWHLANDRIGTNDLNISDVWSSGQRGKGVNVCLIDDGLDFKSPDLKDNFVSLPRGWTCVEVLTRSRSSRPARTTSTRILHCPSRATPTTSTARAAPARLRL
jgi:kexin